MPLGLVAGVRTQDQGWPFQEVHHCATHVMIAYREKNCRIYTALTPKLLSQYLQLCTYAWPLTNGLAQPLSQHKLPSTNALEHHSREYGRCCSAISERCSITSYCVALCSDLTGRVNWRIGQMHKHQPLRRPRIQDLECTTLLWFRLV